MHFIVAKLQNFVLFADEATDGVVGETSAAAGDYQAVIRNLIAAILFSFVGIIIMCFSFWLMNILSPFSLKHEIEEDQNTSLGIIMGSVVIGISIIIAAAIMG